ncbi:MAG: hypothetical protein KDC54_10685 [Lewinella sp.]|nr:hypothetical protein [Lewinella sp.]
MSYHLPTTIEGVLEALDDIIADTQSRNSPLGVFAYVYRRTTAQIKTAMEDGAFEDAARMERLDVTFANLYIQAYREYRAGEMPSQAWAIAFTGEQDRLALIQHLLLGMNAHINLDLGVAAARIMEGTDIEALGPDYHKVNDILAGLTIEMQQRLGRVSPLLFLLDWIGQRSDEKVANFSIKVAREQSWRIARELATLPPLERPARIERVDTSVTELSSILKQPKSRLLRTVLGIIRRFESSDLQRVIEVLKSSADFQVREP